MNAVKELRNKLLAEPAIHGRLSQFQFSPSVSKPSIFSERVPFNARNPLIVIGQEGGAKMEGTRGSRAFADLIELTVRFNPNSSVTAVKKIGNDIWNVLDRYVVNADEGKYWFSCERPQLFEEDDSLECVLDVRVNFLEI